jgi:hypothetical protein
LPLIVVATSSVAIPAVATFLLKSAEMAPANAGAACVVALTFS